MSGDSKIFPGQSHRTPITREGEGKRNKGEGKRKGRGRGGREEGRDANGRGEKRERKGEEGRVIKLETWHPLWSKKKPCAALLKIRCFASLSYRFRPATEVG